MAGRPILRAALFDAGGTLIRLDFEWMAANVALHGFPLSPPALRAAEVGGRRCYDASDRRSARSYWEGMLAGARVPESLRPEVVADWERRQAEVGLWVRPMEGASEVLRRVREAGARVGVISNSDGRAEDHLRRCGLREDVEFVLDSARVGFEKPDPRIFDQALRRLDAAGEEAVFVGDMLSVDGLGARAAGVRFVLVDETGDYGPPEQARVRGLSALPGLLASWYRMPD